MNGGSIRRKLQWLLFPVAIGALLLAACAQATPTAAPRVPVPTGSAPTSAPTRGGRPTQAGTPAAAGENSTPAPIGQGTAQPNSALLIDSNVLIGLPVVDSSHNQAGSVADVLVDSSGAIKSVVLNVNGTGAGVSTPSASETPEATAAVVATASGVLLAGASGTAGPFSTANPLGSTGAVATLDAGSPVGAVPAVGAVAPAASVAAPIAGSPAAATPMNSAGYVIVDWSQFSPDPANNRLIYHGATSALMGSTAFDELSVCSDLIMPGGSGAGAGLFTGMWRLAAPLNTVAVQDMSGAHLGGLHSVILDLTQGQALYAVLSLGNGAASASAIGGCPNSPAGTGLATPGASTTVIVPFTNLSLSTSSVAGANPPVIVAGPSTKVQSAPNLNSLQVALWPQMAPPGWNTQINSYWGVAGQ